MSDKSTKRREGLKTLRKQADLTQARFAFAVGTTEKAVRDWENGGAIPSFDKAIAMAKVLNVPLKRLAQELGLDISGIPDDANDSESEEMS